MSKDKRENGILFSLFVIARELFAITISVAFTFWFVLWFAFWFTTKIAITFVHFDTF